MSRATLAVEAWGRMTLLSSTQRLTKALFLATSALMSRFSGVVNGAE